MDKDIELEILKVLQIVKQNQDLEEKKRFENNKEIVQVLKEMNNKIEKIKEFPPPKESENKIDNRFTFEAKPLEKQIEKLESQITKMSFSTNKIHDLDKKLDFDTFYKRVSETIENKLNSKALMLNYISIGIIALLLGSNIVFLKLYKDSIDKNQEIYDEYLGEYNSLQKVMVGDSKYWYDKDQKELYIKTTEEIKKSKEIKK